MNRHRNSKRLCLRSLFRKPKQSGLTRADHTGVDRSPKTEASVRRGWLVDGSSSHHEPWGVWRQPGHRHVGVKSRRIAFCQYLIPWADEKVFVWIREVIIAPHSPAATLASVDENPPPYIIDMPPKKKLFSMMCGP